MGRRTWESLPRPLPERQNIVVTRQAGMSRPTARKSRTSLADALAPRAHARAGVLHRRRRAVRATRCRSRTCCTSPRSIATSTATRCFPRSTGARGAKSRASRRPSTRRRLRVRFRHLRRDDSPQRRGASTRCRERHFHVHGPHEHEVEHQAQSGDSFAGRIAVTTAILATVGALFSYQGGATQNDALLFKNDAAIKKTEASDQWNFYQAKSNKQNLAELGATLDDRRGRRALQGGGQALHRREEGHPEEGGGAREGGRARPTREARSRCTSITAGRSR